MTRAVVPIRDMQRRIPEAGRIRFGVKTGRAMKALSTFRFTSHDDEALRQIAALYGGEVKPWSDPKAADGQFEVITLASEIRVVLPPDPLGGTPIYEQWGGGGCERRCDGLTAQVVTRGVDGAEMTDVPCICSAQAAMSCSPRTRLSVLLAEIRFGGVWRLETQSWNAAQEMPGMVDLIQSLQERGLTRGVLALKHRRSVVAGETHKFIVPVLGVDETLDALASGAAQVGSLGAGDLEPVAELEAGPPSEEGAEHDQPSGSVAGVEPGRDGDPPPSADDDIVDAEIVDERASADEHHILRQAVSFLDEADLAEVKVWWAENELPSIKDSDPLTSAQVDAAMSHLDELHERRQARLARAEQVAADNGTSVSKAQEIANRHAYKAGEDAKVAAAGGVE